MLRITSFFIVFIFLAACSSTSKLIFADKELEIDTYFNEADVKGAFLVCDLETNNYRYYNNDLLDSGFIPASTFKIVNSIIALETGVIKELSDTISWDGVKRPIESWNASTDMKTAYKNSTVWFYQEIARRIGEQRMKEWLHKLHYGNETISGGIDQFWLTGDLRISPIQQLYFLKKIVERKLPISEETYMKLQDLMLVEKTDNYLMRAKTGWGMQNNMDIGWYVGYVTVNDKNHVFVNLVINSNENNQKFVSSRTDIAKKILRDQKIITF